MNKLILAFFILLFTSKADCQQKDFVLLNGVKFEHKWNKYWSSSLALQTMLNENSSELWIAFADLGVT